METIVLNLLLVGIILFGTSFAFYKIIQGAWGSSEYSTISVNRNDKDLSLIHISEPTRPY